MNKKIENILEKYSEIEFVYEKDKKLFLDFLSKISKKIELNNISKLKDFLQILEYNFLEYSKFDKEILYNPVELVNSIFENDFFWEKIDNQEFEKILEWLSFFEKYLEWKILKKEFLEKKYWVKIIFIKEDIVSISAWIFWKWLTNFSEIRLIDKIKKLLNFYPIIFIKNIKLDSIIVVNNFYKQDIYGQKIVLWWFETFSDNNIYLSKTNLIEAFDHELYHQAMWYYDDFSKWQKIRKKQNKKYLYKNIEKKVFGFARNYWKENVWEDQATMAEELILNYSSLQKRLESDKKLKLKLKLVKKAFLKLSDWIMNEKWWIDRKK